VRKTLLLVIVVAAADATTYDFLTFAGPGGANIQPAAINNSGQIVGYYVDSAGTPHGFLRATDGTITTIDVPGATATIAASISNTGWIVGSYANSGTTVGEIVGQTVNHGFTLSPDGKTLTTFDVPGASTTVPIAVNSSGLVVGQCSLASDPYVGVLGFMMSPDGKTFTTFSAVDNTYPAGMNDNGDVVGYVYGEEGSTRQGWLRTADGTLTTIQDTLGNETRAFSVNNNGQIVGYYQTEYYVDHAFLRNTDGTYITLDPTGLGNTAAVAIDSSGQIIGGFGPYSLRNPDGSYIGVSVPGAGSSSVSAINDSGQIAGGYTATGSDGKTHSYGFLATAMLPSGGPQIRPYHGVIGASGYGASLTAAPESWIEIYGENLAGSTRPWQASDFTGNMAPTSLDEVSVSVNGQPAYLAYVSPEQVNAQIPFSAATGAAEVTVTYTGTASPPEAITLNATAPGLLIANGTLAPVFPDGTPVSTFSPGDVLSNAPNPAHAGDTIVFYGIGFGPVTPPALDGQVATQLSQVQSDFRIYFDGGPPQPATPTAYAGLALGSLGLYQFNVVVPANLAPAGSSANIVQVTWSVDGIVQASICNLIVAQ